MSYSSQDSIGRWMYSNGTGRFGDKIRADKAKFTSLRIEGFPLCQYLITESEMFIEYETFVQSGC